MERNTKMKNKKIGIILVLTALIVLAGCGYTEEEKREIENIEKQGRINAVNYINDKYGINPEVEDVFVQKVDSSPIPDFSPSPNGSVLVTMRYGSKTFKVDITGKEESIDGRDDYQNNEIAEIIDSYVREMLNINPHGIRFQCGYDGLIHTKVQKNIQDLLDPKDRLSILVTTSDDVDYEKISQYTLGEGSLIVINSDDQSVLSKIEEDYRNQDLSYNLENLMSELNYYYYLYRGEWQNHTITKGEVDTGVLYCYDQFIIGDAEVKRVDEDVDAYKWNGHGFVDASSLSNVYSVSMNRSESCSTNTRTRIRIVFDKSVYSGKDIKIGTVYLKNGEDTYKCANTFEEEKYYTASLYEEENQRIVLLKELDD